MSKFKLSISIVILFFGLVGGSLFLIEKIGSDVVQANLLEFDEIPEAKNIVESLDYETLIAEGDTLMDAAYYELASEKYDAATKLNPNNPRTYHLLGNSYLQTQEFDKATQNFFKAYTLSPNNLEYAISYGKGLIRTKEFDKALDHFQSLNKESQDVRFYSSLLKAYKGDYEGSREDIQESANYGGDIKPSYLQAINEAFQNFDLQQNGQEIFLQALLGKAMVDVEEYQLAQAMALKILNLQEDYRDVWTLLGYSQLKLKEYEDARESLSKALKIDPLKPEIHYFLALSNYFLEDYSQAVKYFELALLYGFKPESELYRKIAESQLFLEQYEESLSAYEYLLKIENGNVDDYVRPVWLAIEKVKDLDRALTLAKEAENKYPSQAMSHNLLAWTYLEQGELNLAEKSLNRALQIDPTLAEAHYNAGLLKEAQEKKDDALEEYAKAYELSKAGDNISEKASEAYNRLIIEKSQ